MSRALSARALRAFFAQDCDENVILLLKLYGANLAAPIYLANGHTQRLDALTTDDDVFYGVVSQGVEHVFLPFTLEMPSDEADSAPRASLTIHNATGLITSEIRTLNAPPKVRIQVVLQGSSAADNGTAVSLPEISIDGLDLTGISYNQDTVTGNLSIESLATEPFPCHTMTPATFYGLF